jgi:thiol-disulfide isomerase/thioredoxin
MSKLLLTFFVFTFFVFSAHAQKEYLPADKATKKLDAEGLKALLPNAERKQPVLINFWATWCGPCYSEFPDLVKIDADYRAKGLNFVVVSVDNPSFIDNKVPEFLQQFNAPMPSYLMFIPGGRREIAKAVRQIAPTFRDVYPLTLLFDTSGKLVFQKIGRVNPKLLRTEIDKILPKTEK